MVPNIEQDCILVLGTLLYTRITILLGSTKKKRYSLAVDGRAPWSLAFFPGFLHLASCLALPTRLRVKGLGV